MARIDTIVKRSEGKPVLLERRYIVPFALVTTLFFSWAMAAQLNDILVRQFQKALELSRGEAGFIQTAFYFGYFFGAIPAGLAMRRWGYKNGILVGLALYCGGALMFYPAADVRLFGLFLAALYTIAFGLAFLETAANPYVAVMGDARTGPARLNIAQSFYGIGAFLGPFLGAAFIFSGVEHSAADIAVMAPAELEAWRVAEAKTVQGPYVWLAACVAAIAVLILLTRFPAVAGEGEAAGRGSLRDLKRHPHLLFAAMTQFLYVGAQVCIWSYFIDFVKDMSPDTTEKEAGRLLSYGFLMLMVGRFTGGVAMRWLPAHRLLIVYASAALGLVCTAILSGGWTAIWALWVTTFFMSIMWPTVFALGVDGLGPLTKLGSSLMIMAIVGGALFPPLMGYAADTEFGIQVSLVIPLFGFVAVLLFGLRGWKAGKDPVASMT